MKIVEQALGQLRPANTTATSLVSPSANTRVIIKVLVICNTTAALATYRVFFDDNGTTYDESTALFYDVSIQGNQTVQIDTFYTMNNSSGNLAVRTDTANALTFTAFGAEITG